ncbi:MAG: hypothetical protein LQ349_005668 [Xanthoria aureola]|nr:MAG: hypothetical protein LQ349_005668 [Xanthoria aureola]
MKLSFSLSCASLLLSAHALASDASIYLSDASDTPAPQVLSPHATRLLLARRLGVSRYHSLEGADEPTLKTLNEFGGQQKSILSPDERWQDPQRNLIIIEDIENPREFLDPKLHPSTFTMANAPESFQTHQLVNDLFEQAKEVSFKGGYSCSSKYGNKGAFKRGVLSTVDGATGACSVEPAPSRVLGMAQLFTDLKTKQSARTAIVRLSFSDFANDKDLPQAKKDLSQVLSGLLRPAAREKDQESTVIIMPPSNVKAKRSSTSGYGSYAMPQRQPLQAREGQTEAPLAAPSAPQTSLASDQVSTSQTLKGSSVLKPGILPVCQPNLEKLIEVTNNCSGHGTPYLKGKDLDEKAQSVCYACKCSKTVLSRGEGQGVKTIHWAGPACSKKDVSAPFWLLAGISIAMVATVAWGVGLLFSIGQEDLPSVIGAGVTGPRAQK